MAWGKWRQALTAAAFLLPAALLLAVFVYWPMITTVRLSFFQWNMISPTPLWVGGDNYREVLRSRELAVAALNTVWYVLLLLVANLVLPYGCAYVLAHVVRRGQNFYKCAIFLPSVLSLAVASVIFLWIFNPITGPVNAALRWLGMMPPSWFKAHGWVIVALAVITAWKCFGYNFILLLAGIANVPAELIEAARLDGASKWTIFRRIVLPLTAPTALYVLSLTVVMGAQYVFVPIQMLTGGGPDQGSTNLIFLIYQYGFQFFTIGKAGAVALITLLLFAGFIVLQGRVLERGVHYEN